LVAKVDDRLGAFHAILLELLRLHAVDSDGDLLAFKIRGTEIRTRKKVFNVGHDGLLSCCVSYSRSWRHQIHRRRRRFPWYGNRCKIVSGDPPPRHSPSNRPAPALSGFPSSERVNLFRRGLGEEEILGSETFRCDMAVDQLDALPSLGFGHRRGRCNWLPLLLFEYTHDDRRGRRTKARRYVFDPPCSFFAKAAAMLTAVGADEFAAGGD